MIITIVVALLALLAERALRVIDLVVGWQGSLLVIVEMLGYLIPHYLGLALPIAFFLGIMLVFGRLSKEGEIDAMMAAGAGMPRLIRPLILAALFLTLIEALLVSYLQPFSRYGYRAAIHTVTSVSFQRLLQPGIFTTLGQTTYIVSDLSDDRSQIEQIFLYSKRDDGSSVVVTAETGMIEPPAETQPLILKLRNGVNQALPAASADGGALGQALTLRFGEFETDLAGSEPKPFRPRGDDEREYTLVELAGYLGAPPEHVRADEISAEFHGRMVRILTIPLLPFLALPLAIERRRSQRSSGLVIGLAILIGYNQIVQFGESMADDGQVSAFVGLWLPYLVFAAIACSIFYRAAFRVPDVKESVIDRVISRLTQEFAAWQQSSKARS